MWLRSDRSSILRPASTTPDLDPSTSTPDLDPSTSTRTTTCRRRLVTTRSDTAREGELPPALQRMVEIRRDIESGRSPVPAELWIATGQR